MDSRLPITPSEVELAAKEQMAMKLEDILARRSRCLFLDARATMDIAPEVAQMMAAAMGHDEAWVASEVEAFNRLAAFYLPGQS